VPRVRPAFRAAVLLAAVLCVLAGAVLVARPGAGVAADTPAPAGEKDTMRFADGTCADTAVRFGVVQPPADAAARAAAERLGRGLTEGLGCRVVVVAYPTQASLVTALAVHEVEVGQLDPAAVVVADRAVGSAAIGAYAVDESTPARAPRVALWTRGGGDVRALGDLRGRPIAFGPQLTAGGDLEPRAALLRAGVATAGSGDARSVFTADDASALRALRSGRVDAAVTRGRVRPSSVRGLRRVWSATGPLADVLVLRPGMPSAVRRLMVVAVRGLSTAALAPLAARQGITEPAPLTVVPLDLYAPVADRLDSLTVAGLQP
jgi:ABC-type phosphate/phosphonate transport system substrate-binding protein